MARMLTIPIALALVIGLAYVIWRPRWAIALVLLMFPLEQLLQSYIPVLVTHSWVINVTIGAVALLAFFSVILRGSPQLREYLNPTTTAILLLYGLSLVGLLWTPSRQAALAMIKMGFPYWILMLLIAPALLEDLDDFRRLLVPIMCLGAVIALLILIHPDASVRSGRLFLDVSKGRDKGGNPLALANLGGAIALFAVLMRPRTVTLTVNAIRVAAFVLGLGLAIGSGSRGQVLAVMMIGVAFFPVARQLGNPKQFLLTMIGLAVLGLGFYITIKLFIGTENRARWDLGLLLADSRGRFALVESLLGAYLASPMHWLFGLGPNAFTAIYAGDTPYVHNAVAEVLCEEGAAGLVCMVIAVVFAYQRGLRVWKFHRSDPVYRSTIGILVAMSAYTLLLALKQGSHLGLPVWPMWLMLLAKVSLGELSVLRSGVALEDAVESDAQTDDGVLGEWDGYGEGASEPLPAP